MKFFPLVSKFFEDMPQNVLLGVAALFVFGSGTATGVMLSKQDSSSSPACVSNGSAASIVQRGVDPRATVVPIDAYEDKKTKLW